MSTTSAAAVQSFVVSPQNNNMSAGSSSSSNTAIVADHDQICFDDLSGAFNYHIHDDGDDLRHTLSLSHFEDAFSSWPIFPNLTPLAYVPPHPTPLLLLDPTPPPTTTNTINSSHIEPENSIPNEQNHANDDNNNNNNNNNNMMMMKKNHDKNNNDNDNSNSADDSSSYLLPAPFGRSDSVHTVVEAMATSLSPVANKQRHADESSMYFDHPQMKKHLLPINQQDEIEEHHGMKKQKLMISMPSSIYLEPINQFPISNFQQPQQQRTPLLVNTSSSHAMTFSKCKLESSKLQQPTSPSGSSVGSISSSSSCFSDICEQPAQQQQQQQTPPKQGNGRIRKRVSLSSPFRGVSRCGKDHKYQARIRDGQKVHYLGRFNDEIVAAIRYDEASRNFKNIGASTNFTDEIWKSPELLERIASVGNIQTHVPEWIFPYLTASVRQKLLNKISKNSLCLIPSSSSVQLQKDLKKSSCV